MPAVDSTIADCLQAIPQVEAVYVLRDGNEGLSVLSVVNEEDDAVYERIYLQEMRVAKCLPSIHFDFNVVARRGRPVNLIVGNNLPIWVRQASECQPLKSI